MTNAKRNITTILLIVLVWATIATLTKAQHLPPEPDTTITTQLVYPSGTFETIAYPDCVAVGDKFYLPERSAEVFIVIEVRHEIYNIAQTNQIRRRLVKLAIVPPTKED